MTLPIDADFGARRGTHTFRSPAEIRDFIQEQNDGWQWLEETLQTAQNPNNAITQIHESMRIFRRLMNNTRTQIDANAYNDAVQSLIGYYNNANSLPTLNSIDWNLISQVRSEISNTAALGAIAALLKLRFDAGDPDQVRGVLLAHELLQGAGKAARKSVQDGLASALRRHAAVQDRIEAQAEDLDRRVTATERRGRDGLARLLRAAVRARHRFRTTTLKELEEYRTFLVRRIDEIDHSASSAIESIQHTEQVYKEHMALKGPVTYWTDKADEHRRKANIARYTGLAFAASLVTYAYIDGAWRVLDWVKDTVATTGRWQLAYVVLTIVAFVLTVAFWIGRLISRTYVSQTHLALDAEERATMVQTYLALTEDGKADKDDRALVLASLFRASSDGLVRDDAAPDLSLPAIAARLGAGASAAGRS